MESQRPLVEEGLLRCLSTRFIFLSSSPEALYNSIITFYDVFFNSSYDFYPTYKNNSAKIISTNRLMLDSFIVNSMTLVGNTSLLALGIQDFGVLIYDVD